MKLFVPNNTASVTDKALTHIQMYPNRVSDNLYIINIQPGTDIAIYSLSGVMVANYVSNSDNISLDLSELKTGAYLIRFSKENEIATERFIKQ